MALKKKAPVKKAAKAVYLVPSVDKALEILAILKKKGREMSLAEIARAAHWPKSSVQRLLTTLGHHGFVQRDDAGKKYSLGMTLAEYGRMALKSIDIRKLAKPFLQALVDYSGETAVLAILDETKMIMVDKREPLIKVRVSPFIGTRFPGTATSNGKVLLAWLPEKRVDEILQIEGLPASTGKSIARKELFKADLAAVRDRRYAIDREEFQGGVSGVSAPVFNQKGEVIAALSIVGPAFRMSDENIKHYGEKCVDIAAQLSAQLV